MKLLLKITYYLAATVLGYLFALVALGSAVESIYMSQGEVVDLSDQEAVLRGFEHGMTTRNIIDLDGTVGLFIGSATEIFPEYRVDGTLSTPVTIHRVFQISTIVIFLVGFWVMAFLIGKMRRNIANK